MSFKCFFLWDVSLERCFEKSGSLPDCCNVSLIFPTKFKSEQSNFAYLYHEKNFLLFRIVMSLSNSSFPSVISFK